jgi:hypothetical protein
MLQGGGYGKNNDWLSVFLEYQKRLRQAQEAAQQPENQPERDIFDDDDDVDKGDDDESEDDDGDDD